MSDKLSSEIVKWGVIKPYFDKEYRFNSIDIETIDNELFLLGYVINNQYKYELKNFYKTFHDILIKSCQFNRDIVTWSRYDNTHLLKLLLKNLTKSGQKTALRKLGKVTPIIEYDYKGFRFVLENVIRDCMIFNLIDKNNKSKRVTIYNIKNLFATNLETTAKNYKLDYYSKLGIEYHIIDKKRFESDLEYNKMTLLSNELDNRVIIDIANTLISNFRSETGVNPKSIFTAGSIARSYLLAQTDISVHDMNFKNKFMGKTIYDTKLLDYSMRAYHGGKIESYVLGYIENAYMTDKTQAYPYAIANLEKLTDNVEYLTVSGDGLETVKRWIDNNFYAFIKCDVEINDKTFIHPLIVKNPLNDANISPYGYIYDIVITKPEYEYLIKYPDKVKLTIKDVIIVTSEKGNLPYKPMIEKLVKIRNDNSKTNPAKADLFKTINNSGYGIRFELTDTYKELPTGEIVWEGYRAGDFFNPIEASYITANTRVNMSELAQHIVDKGGEVLLIMTDSIIWKGADITLDIFTPVKVLGKFTPPESISKVMILGAGRYEYYDDFKQAYTIKSRGFSVKIKDKAFYSNLDFKKGVKIDNTVFVSPFKSTLKKYSFNELGHLLNEEYSIDPFNMGGKRIIENYDIDLTKEYTKTNPVRLDKYLYMGKEKEA